MHQTPVMVYVTAREGEQEKMGHHDEVWFSSPWVLLAPTPVSCTRPLYEKHDTIEWTQQPEKEEKERIKTAMLVVQRKE